MISLCVYYIQLLSDRLMVRVGGGWDTLDHFLLKHDPCRIHSIHTWWLSYSNIMTCAFFITVFGIIVHRLSPWCCLYSWVCYKWQVLAQGQLTFRATEGQYSIIICYGYVCCCSVIHMAACQGFTGWESLSNLHLGYSWCCQHEIKSTCYDINEEYKIMSTHYDI